MTNRQLLNAKKRDYEKALRLSGNLLESEHLDWERRECHIAYKSNGVSRIEIARFYCWGNGISCNCKRY